MKRLSRFIDWLLKDRRPYPRFEGDCNENCTRCHPTKEND